MESSSISSIGYDADAQALEIEFHSGTIYRYFDVAAPRYLEFLRAESKGRYFMGKIRGKYRYQRIEARKK